MDWSWLDTVVGGGTAVAAYVIGQARGRRRARPDLEPQAVCGCGHHYALHDAQAVCHGTNRIKNAAGHEGVTWSSEACGCRRYTGPEPLPTYIP
jgi:hypothetical protein